MENRAKVVCHMLTTIDGKILIDWDGNEDYEIVGQEYDPILYSYGDVVALGRVTCQDDYEVQSADLTSYQGAVVEYTDQVELPQEGEGILLALDRFGKLGWTETYVTYAGRKLKVVEALTEQVKPEFLAFLKEKGIPYLFAGEKEFDLVLLLKKMKELCKAETVMLCGGAEINAEFMKQDLIDEISLVIGPGVDGTREGLNFVGTKDTAGFPKFYKVKEVRAIGGNGVLLHYTK